jgi:pimeloyl-ACP methyl ester carboxylesterase
VGELMGKLMRRPDVERTLRKSFAHQQNVTSEVVNENWAPLSRRENRAALWKLQRRLDLALTEERLPAVRAATLVLWGSEDRFDAPAQAPELGRRIAGARVRILPGCGHSAHEDCPAAANAALLDFLLRPR